MFSTDFQRAIDSFVFMVDRRPSALDKQRFAEQNWKGVSVIGAVATLIGESSQRVQCGWFQTVKWRWLHLPNITHLEVRSDDRFRRG